MIIVEFLFPRLPRGRVSVLPSFRRAYPEFPVPPPAGQAAAPSSPNFRCVLLMCEAYI